MRDEQRTKRQLIDELTRTRQRIAELEASGVQHEQTAEALRESHEGLTATFDAASNVAFVTTDLNGTESRILDFSVGAERIFGYRREEAIGKPVAILHVPGDVGGFPQVIEAMQRRKTAVTGELELIRKGGEKFPAVLAILPLFDAQGDMTRALGVSIDMTERKRAQEALKESEERYRTLIENVDVGVCRTTAEMPGRYLHVNAALARMLGHDSVEEMMAMPVRSVYQNPEDRVALLEELHRNGRAKNKEVRLVRKDGTPMWAWVTATAVFREDGTVQYMDTAMEDVTEHKQADERLLAYQERLRTLAAELSLAEERERRQIAVDLHDRIGQPLAISAMKLGALQRSRLKFAGSLEEIAGLVDQALQAAYSLTSELSSPILYELGFEPAVEWLAEQIQKEHGIRIEVQHREELGQPDEEVRVFLFRAIRELLLNVVRHARANSASVAIRRDGDEIRVDVRDDGVGFDAPQEALHWQTDGGFGLFSIRERLDHLGGRVGIRSKVGQGTQVTLVAPLRRPTRQTGGQGA